MTYKTLHDVPIETLKSVILKSESRTEVFINLGMLPRGAKFHTLKKLIELHSINIDHFKTVSEINRRKLALSREDVLNLLTKSTQFKSIKNYLIKFNILPYICNECGLSDIWNNRLLTLQLDHIDGDCLNNELSNLRFLCPNCHSQTTTFAGRNKPHAKSYRCSSCESEVNRESSLCIKCAAVQREKINWPNDDELMRLVWSKPLTDLGVDLGVNDNSIRKRCLKRKITLPSKGFWLKGKAPKNINNRGRIYIIKDIKTGEVYEVDHLTKWAKDHNVSAKYLRNLAKPNAQFTQHKGFSCSLKTIVPLLGIEPNPPTSQVGMQTITP